MKILNISLETALQILYNRFKQLQHSQKKRYIIYSQLLTNLNSKNSYRQKESTWKLSYLGRLVERK
jgi:hypothetical protein